MNQVISVEEKPNVRKFQNIYEPLDLYMVRTPLLPLEIYTSLFKDLENVDDPSKMMSIIQESTPFNIVKEAIAISSPSLINSILNFDGIRKERKRDQVIKSLIRYLIRMTTRSTPFGISAGVTYGTFSDESKAHIGDILQHKKRSRPDMEWLLKIVERLESNIEVVEQLNVQINSMIYRVGNRLKLPYKSIMTQNDIGNEIESPSIRLTPAVKDVLNVAKQPISIALLIEEIQMIYPDTKMSVIKHFLLDMLKSEFLISDLRPPLTITNPFNYLIDKINNLQGIDDLKNDLQKIHSKITVYDNLNIGDGYSLYSELVKDMKTLYNAKNPLQIDLALNNTYIKLNQIVESIS